MLVIPEDALLMKVRHLFLTKAAVSATRPKTEQTSKFEYDGDTLDCPSLRQIVTSVGIFCQCSAFIFIMFYKIFGINLYMMSQCQSHFKVMGRSKK